MIALGSARRGVVGFGAFSLQEPPDPATETVGCVSPQWLQSSPSWVVAGCLFWVAAGCLYSFLRKLRSSPNISVHGAGAGGDAFSSVDGAGAGVEALSSVSVPCSGSGGGGRVGGLVRGRVPS